MKAQWHLFFLLLWSSAAAQPGGGGGLVIKQLYMQQGKALVPVDRSTVQMRLFALADTAADAAIAFEMPPAPALSYEVGGSTGFVKLPSTAGLQRLYLTSNGKVMLIDWLGILPENPSGGVGRMDSLVFMPGYFRVWGNQRGGLSLVPAAVPRWQARHALTYRRRVRLDFLQPKNLPASYFLQRGQDAVSESRFQAALPDLQRALAMTLPTQLSLRAYALLAEALSQTHHNDSAIATISRAIAAIGSPTVRSEGNTTETLANYYRQRISYLTTARRYDLALRDYNTLVQLPYPPTFRAYNEEVGAYNEEDFFARARFKAKYFRGRPEYAEATQEIQARLDSVPAAAFGCGPAARSYQLGYLVFALANAEYDGGQLQSAFRHWSQAMEMGTSYQEYRVPHFDSLLARHPNEPELMLGRIFAVVAAGTYAGSAKTNQAVYEQAILDLNAAERAGLTDYRLYYHRARFLSYSGQPAKALAQINAAIKTNPAFPKAYYLRWGIRVALGQAKSITGQANAEKLDPDRQRYDQLCAQWHPARY